MSCPESLTQASRTSRSGLRFECLAGLQRPLMNKFYKAHNSRMRVTGEQAWVARQEEIIAALNLTQIADGHWLTGLFCAPPARRSGVASELMRIALAAQKGPVWLFCEAPLEDFYQRLGFVSCDTLPGPLAQRFHRYRHTRALHALVRDHHD